MLRLTVSLLTLNTMIMIIYCFFANSKRVAAAHRPQYFSIVILLLGLLRNTKLCRTEYQYLKDFLKMDS